MDLVGLENPEPRTERRAHCHAWDSVEHRRGLVEKVVVQNAGAVEEVVDILDRHVGDVDVWA
jgi:hypothetical protein